MAPARARLTRILFSLLVLGLLSPLVQIESAGTPPAAAGGQKLALAFYYMWYGPSGFSNGLSSDQPTAAYISDHKDTIKRQLDEARWAGLDGFITSWWGKDDITDKNLAMLLDEARGSDFNASIYFETVGDKMKGAGAAVDQLRYVAARYMSHPNWLRYRGKPVVFFWKPDALGGPAAWRQVRDAVDPKREQIWSAETTDTGYLDAFDGIHLFSAAKWASGEHLVATNKRFRSQVDAYNATHGTDRIWAAGAMPGYDDHRLPGRVDPVIARAGGAYYRESLAAALASNPEWLTITSFNEWYEGTQIEPSVSYGRRYLEMTREAIAAWKGTSNPCDGGTFFKETGHSICRTMESYWRQYGGLTQFGYPISAAAPEKAANGRTYTVQYFERARFELHPENAGTPHEVQLGHLGRALRAQDPPAAPIEDGAHTYFAATGHNVGGAFLRYWTERGGLFVNGYPLTEELQEKLQDGRVYKVQYFERARFEYHPENAGTPHEVLLGFLGKMAMAAR